MSICPKNKSSKSRRDKRRANWKMTIPALVKCSRCGELMVSHRVCKNCGCLIKEKSFRRIDESRKKAVVKVQDAFCGSFFFLPAMNCPAAGFADRQTGAG